MPPQGICGSGLIDAVAELLRCGLLGVSGRLAGEKSPALSQPLGGRLRTVGGMREFVLAFAGEQGNERDIVITQKDIRELQLAKAAIAAGIAVLLKEVKIEASQIDQAFRSIRSFLSATRLRKGRVCACFLWENGRWPTGSPLS